MQEQTGKLGFGLMRLPRRGVKIDVDQIAEMADMFLDAGFTYFDTAYVYPGSEEAVRKALVSRHPQPGMLGYNDLDEQIMSEYTVIVNCTPLGMYPDVDACPEIPYQLISARHLLFDCIYNPEETLFLKRGKAQGATIRNGLEMLLGQAKAAWKIWGGGAKRPLSR